MVMFLCINETNTCFVKCINACGNKKRETNTSKRRDMVNMYKSEIEEIDAIDCDMQEHIDSCQKESGKHVAYSEQRTAYFEDAGNITIDSASVIPQQKKNVSKEDLQENPYDKNEVNRSIRETRAK